jgi:hypothetical protein
MSEGFSDPLVNFAGALVYPSVHSPNFNINNPSASPNPSWGVLQNGQAYFFGLTLTGGTFNGTDYIIDSDGEFFYSGAPANGNLNISISPNGGVDGFGNAFNAGVMVGAIGSSSGSYIQFDSTGMTFKNVHNAGGGLFPTTTVTMQGSPSTDIVTIKATPSGGGTGVLRFDGNMEFINAPQMDSGILLEPEATPAAPSNGSIAYSDSNSYARVVNKSDGQAYALGAKLIQAFTVGIAGTGAYTTVATATVGIGTYRLEGTIAYSAASSPTGAPRVRFDSGSATQGHARGQFSSLGVPVAVDKSPFISTDTFAGAATTTSEQVMSFDMIVPFTSTGTFIVSAASTGNAYNVNFINFVVTPM